MEGISSESVGSLTNRHKYNGKEIQKGEFSDGTGLELYDYGARMHDPQIGRWNVIDPLSRKNFDVSPFAYVRNNPISKLDPDGNTDYDVVVKTTTDAKTGAVTRTLDVTVKYNIIDISSKGDVVNSSQIAGSGYKDGTFSTNFKVGKGDLGNKTDINVIVNVSIEYNVVDDINMVSNNENVLFIVDDVQRETGDRYEPAGRGELQGQTAAVEFQAKGNKSLVQHELGHNFGLEHVETPGNLMNPYTKGNLSNDQKKQPFFGISGLQDGKHHMGGRNAQQEAKNFINHHALTYDQEKKRKAGL